MARADLYPAEDADKIREYLYLEIARAEFDTRAPSTDQLAQIKKRHDDPIHTIFFYLTEERRAELYELYKVKVCIVNAH